MASRVPAAVTRTVSPGQIVAAMELAQHRFDDGFRLGQPAVPDHATSERAFVRRHNPYPATFQNLHVGPRGRMLPHIDVHRRSNNDRRAGGQKQGGQEVVGQAVSELCQDVRGRRRHDQGFGGLGFPNVLNGGVEIAFSPPETRAIAR